MSDWLFAQEVKLSASLARRAGELALTLRDQGSNALNTRQKSQDQGPVTQADLQANQLIVEGITHAFPGDAIVAEESDNSDADRGAHRCWYIDPIDGTSDFAAGRSCWAVHIGLCVDGVPCMGLVFEPELDRATFGTQSPQGEQAQAWSVHRGLRHPIAPAQPTQLPPRAVVSANHRTPLVDTALARLSVVPALTRSIGSTGVKSAIVARQEAEIYVHPSQKTKLWDSCAPEAIVRASGGHMTGIDGSPIRYTQGPMHHPAGLLATRGIDHDQAVQRLAPMTRDWLASLG